MTKILLLLAGALQQPQPAPRPSQVPSSAAVQASSEPAAPTTAMDSTVRAIIDIALKVAEMRSVYDLYRRAAYNEPDGALIQRATMFAASCRDLASTVQRHAGYVCRSCVVRRIQADVDQYRIYLPALQRFGTACANRIEQLKSRGAVSAQSRALRGEANPQGARMVETLRGYETRLQKVRVGMNWTSPTTAPRRGG